MLASVINYVGSLRACWRENTIAAKKARIEALRDEFRDPETSKFGKKVIAKRIEAIQSGISKLEATPPSPSGD